MYFIGRPSVDTARVVPATQAAPPISAFISGIPPAGLIHIPPVSNVIPSKGVIPLVYDSKCVHFTGNPTT